MKLDAAKRQHVLHQAVANLKQFYFDRDLAQKTGDALLAHEKCGEYNSITDGQTFAGLVTRQMRQASGDLDLTLVYSRDRLPDHPPEPTANDLARYRKNLEQHNCFFEKVKILPHNVGYLNLNWLISR